MSPKRSRGKPLSELEWRTPTNRECDELRSSMKVITESVLLSNEQKRRADVVLFLIDFFEKVQRQSKLK